MSNGPDVNSHVTRIEQREADDTLVVYVQTAGSFAPGQPVEVSGYLIQASGAYTAFNVKKHAPLDGSNQLPVSLPAMNLNMDEDVTVVTQVAEVWPTTLEKDKYNEYIGKGIKAAWTAKDYPGKGSGGSGSLSGNGDGGPTPDPRA